MNQISGAGKLPNWTLLVPIAWFVATAAGALALYTADSPWQVFVPYCIVCLVVSVVLERFIKRKYLQPKAGEEAARGAKSNRQ